MTKEEMTDIIVSTKKAKGLTWQAIAEAVGMAKEWVTSACLGMNKMNADQANKLVSVARQLNSVFQVSWLPAVLKSERR